MFLLTVGTEDNKIHVILLCWNCNLNSENFRLCHCKLFFMIFQDEAKNFLCKIEALHHKSNHLHHTTHSCSKYNKFFFFVFLHEYHMKFGSFKYANPEIVVWPHIKWDKVLIFHAYILQIPRKSVYRVKLIVNVTRTYQGESGEWFHYASIFNFLNVRVEVWST